MAKTPKPKPTRNLSTHSRSARRTSLSLLPTTTSTSTSTKIKTKPPPVLAPHHNAGISRKPKPKVLKRKQRQRLELGKERAENVLEKMEVKLRGAAGRWEGRRVRNADWDELNEKIVGGKRGKRRGKDEGEKDDMGVGEGDDRRAVQEPDLSKGKEEIDVERGMKVDVGGDGDEEIT